MQLVTNSKDTIPAHVIRYFHNVFGDPISAFKPSTNVRRAYSYSDRAWRQLANVFNKLSWMRQLGVLLSPREMPGLKTIDDIVSAIRAKLKVVSVSGLSTRSKTTAVPKFAAPKRRTARKPKSSVRKAKSSAHKPKISARKSSARTKIRRKKQAGEQS